MARLATGYVEIRGDFTPLEREIATKLPALGRRIDAAFNERGVGAFNDELGTTRRQVTTTDRSIATMGRSVTRTNANFSLLRNTISTLRLPALAGAAGAGATGLVAAAGGAVSLTSALAPLSGALVAVPALLGAGAQAAGVFGLSLSGLGDVLGAMSDQQTQAGSTATDMAEQTRAAALQVESAEAALASAQRTVRYAQEDLNTAREDATHELEDMRLAAVAAADAEKGAALALREAKKALKEARDEEGGIDLLSRRQLQQQIVEAEHALEAARSQNARSQEDLTEAEKDGVKGSEQVVGARRALAEAQRGAAQASRDLAEAQRSAAKGSEEMGTAAENLEEKLSALPPAAQEFARYLFSLKPRLDELRDTAADGLLPGVEEGMEAALKNFPSLERVIAGTAKEMGGLVAETGEFLGRDGFGRDFETIGRNNTELLGDMGDSGLHFADALRHVMVEAGPLLDWMGEGLVSFSKFIEAEAEAGRETGELRDYFHETQQAIARVVDIGGSLWNVLGDLGRASDPFGEDMLVDLRDGADELERMTGSVEGQNELRDYFRESAETLDELADAIGDILDEGDLTEMLTRAIELAIPVVAKHAGRIGVAVVEGVFAGMADSDLLGKGILGTLLLAKMGLGGFVFQRAGAQGAESFLTGFTGVKGIVGRAGVVGLGIAVADKLMETISDEVAESSEDLDTALAAMAESTDFEEFKESLKDIGDGDILGTLGEFGASISGFDLEEDEEQAAQDLIDLMDKVGAAGGRVSEDMVEDLDVLSSAVEFETKEAADAFADFRASVAIDALKTQNILESKLALRDIRLSWSDEMKKMAGISDSELSKIERLLETKPKQGAAALDDAMKDATRSIRDAMKDGEISSRKGLELINDLIRQRLGTYGIKGSDAEKIIKAKNHPGDVTGLAAGGIARVAGQGLHDSVPLYPQAIVAPGEDLVVANRHQRPMLDAAVAEKYGVAGLPGFFERFDRPHFAPQQGFAAGGIVAVPGFPGEEAAASIIDEIKWVVGNWPSLILTDAFDRDGSAGHSSAGHNITGTAADFSGPDSAMNAAVKALVQKGYTVGYDGSFGSEAWTGHGPSTVTSNYHFHVEFGSASGASGAAAAAEAFKLNLPRFKGKYPMFSPGAEEMNLMVAGLEKVLSQRVGRMNPGSEPMSGGAGAAGALSEGEFLALAKRAIAITDRSSVWGDAAGFSPAGLLTLAKAESSLIPSSINDWDINAQMGNPSGGLMHLTQSNMQAYAEPALGGDMFNPLASIAASINYQIDRYGGQVTHSPYARGGILPRYAKGKGPDRRPIRDIGLPAGMGGSPFGAPGTKQLDAARKLKEKLQMHIGSAAKLDERLMIEESLAGLESSEAGSDLGAKERAALIALNEALLGSVSGGAGVAGKGLKLTTRGIERAQGGAKSRLTELRDLFKTALEDAVGLTGKGGRVFDIQLELAELRGAATSSTEGPDLSELLALSQASNADLLRNLNVSQAQYDVFRNFAGTFGDGGTILPGRWGIAGETGRPEVVHGPATVYDPATSAGMLAGQIAIENNITVSGDYVDVETSVNKVLAKRERVRIRRTPGKVPA